MKCEKRNMIHKR